MTLSGGFWRTVCFSLTALFIFHLNKHIWIDLRGVLMFTLACITVSRCLHTHNNEDWPSSTSLFSLILLQIIFISLLRNTPTPVRLFWSLSLRCMCVCVCYEWPLSRIVLFISYFFFHSINNDGECGCLGVNPFVIGSVLTFAFCWTWHKVQLKFS